MNQHRFIAHPFSKLDDVRFSITEYSRLKFGSDSIAKKFGYDLAITMFESMADIIMSNGVVVIPSPYNHVKNAATIMSEHFINKLNELLVHANGQHIEQSIIHRKVSYINDYGFLSKEHRKGLIDNDNFFMNKQFLKGKTLIFIDDVIITGTHEEKLMEILENNNMNNTRIFAYYGGYNGDDPSIESRINLSAIGDINDYINIINEPKHHVIVRAIKYLLSIESQLFKNIIYMIDNEYLTKIYYGALGEGYYQIPQYQVNLLIIKQQLSL